MEFRSRGSALGAVALSMLAMLGACEPKQGNTVAGKGDRPGETSGDVFRVASVDALSEELARRTQKQLGKADDFQIVVTQANYPIGTLLRQGSTIPIDYSACLPTAAPPVVGAPSLFPSYSLSRETAAAFGLDEAVLKGIAKAGANLSRTNAVKLDFADSSLSTLSDRDIKRIAAVPACAELLAEGPVWLVRGYVFGKRSFHFDRAQANDANLQVSKIASFDVKLADGNSAVVVSDSGPVGFLQIVSALAPAARADAAQAPNAAAIAVVKPVAIQRAGKVYVQRDAGDQSGTDTKVVAALDAANLRVVPKIEVVPTEKMPTVAQVRYFNDGDLELAETARTALAASFQDARVVRIALPSPPGQLEVWLPKAGAARLNPLAVRRSAAAASELLKTR